MLFSAALFCSADSPVPFALKRLQTTEQYTVTKIAATHIASQKMNRPSHEDCELLSTFPATRFNAPQPMYAEALRSLNLPL